MPGRFFGPNRPTLESMRSHARGGSSINAVASAVALRLHGFRNPQPTKPSGEEIRITSPPGIALSKTKMPQKPAGRESRFCRLPIHRHEAGISGKREEDRHRRRADQQRGRDRALVRQRWGSKHRHLPGQRHPSGKPFSRRFTNVWLNQNGRWECIASQSTLITR